MASIGQPQPEVKHHREKPAERASRVPRKVCGRVTDRHRVPGSERNDGRRNSCRSGQRRAERIVLNEGSPSSGPPTRGAGRRYFTSVSSLNIGRYIEMMITPTMQPTAIIITGSMIDVSDWMAASTS